MSANATFRQVRGRMAEDAALAYLTARGLRLLERNARFAVGELDLVLMHGDTLVFAEVRQRKSDAFGGAAHSIDARKRRKCALAAQCWLKRNPRLADAPCRFDAVLLTGTEGDWRIEWLQGAFVFEDAF